MRISRKSDVGKCGNMETDLRWNSTHYGVEVHAGKRSFIVSAMPNMVGRLDCAVKCCETMSSWRLPTYKEAELMAMKLPQINCLMEINGGHRIDNEAVLWLDGDYGHSRSLKVQEGLCYLLPYRKDTTSDWWCRREIRLVMPLRSDMVR